MAKRNVTSRAKQLARKRGLVLPGDREAAQRLQDSLFPAQLGPFLSQRKRVVCSCGRRAGKTSLVLRKMLHVALTNPGTNVLYLALSRDSARSIAWKALRDLARSAGAELLKEPIESDLSLYLANGSMVRLAGVATDREKEKFRGKGYHLAVLDEVKSWDDDVLKETVLDVLGPALRDTGGSLWIIGSPGIVRKGFFYEATQKPDVWDFFHWDMWSNPYMQDPERWIKEDAEKEGVEPGSPAFLREYRGEWVEDEAGRCYRYSEKNLYRGDPPEWLDMSDGTRLKAEWRYVAGVDLGTVDAFAMVVLAYAVGTSAVREVYARKINDLSPEGWAEEINALRKRYRLNAIVVDEGGLGKGIAMDFRDRHGISCEPAEKYDKRLGIRWLNSDLLRGIVQVRADSPVVDEWRELMVDAEGKEDQRAENHLSDAFLYAYRKVRHFRPRQPKELAPVSYGPQAQVASFWRDYEMKKAAALEKKLKKERQRAIGGLFGSPFGSSAERPFRPENRRR